MWETSPYRSLCSEPCAHVRAEPRVRVLRATLKVLAASRSSGRPAGCSYEGPSSQLRSFSTAGSAFWSGVPERVVPKRFRSGFWSGSGAGSGGVPERVPEQVPEVLEQVPERVSGAGSRAFPERFRSGFGAGSPLAQTKTIVPSLARCMVTKDWGIQCPMPYAVLAQCLFW